jgi:hypothetical protein
MYNKKLSYATEQLIHTLRNNGETIRAIEEALGVPRSTVHRTLQKDIKPSYLPEIAGDGCYTTSTHNGELVESTPIDHDEGLSITQPGKLEHLDSGYPDIYYNERTRQWEVWIDNKRLWRATTLVKACEVRVSKGGLSKDEEKLLQAVIDSPIELQEALNYPPI